MAQCKWIQYEPDDSTTPYPGFINAIVNGDDDNPPLLALPRIQIAVSPDTDVDGMMVDANASLVIDPNLLPDPDE